MDGNLLIDKEHIRGQTFGMDRFLNLNLPFFIGGFPAEIAQIASTNVMVSIINNCIMRRFTTLHRTEANWCTNVYSPYQSYYVMTDTDYIL